MIDNISNQIDNTLSQAEVRNLFRSCTKDLTAAEPGVIVGPRYFMQLENGGLLGLGKSEDGKLVHEILETHGDDDIEFDIKSIGQKLELEMVVPLIQLILDSKLRDRLNTAMKPHLTKVVETITNQVHLRSDAPKLLRKYLPQCFGELEVLEDRAFKTVLHNTMDILLLDFDSGSENPAKPVQLVHESCSRLGPVSKLPFFANLYRLGNVKCPQIRYRACVYHYIKSYGDESADFYALVELANLLG